MRTKNTLLNLTVTMGAQGISIFFQFLSRYIFVKFFSEEYLGVNGLFTELLTVLSLAELGIGTSMMYGLYNVISQNDKKNIGRLMNMYKRMYIAVAVIVAIIGILMFPFLGYFVKDTNIPQIEVIYLMYLINSVSSYFFSYKQTLIRADQKEYIISGITQIVKCVQVLIQILIIVFTKNFYIYLSVQIICQIGNNIILAIIAEKKYPYIKEQSYGLPDKKIRYDIYSHIKAMAIHRFGSVFVFNTDNLIISMFVGLGTVGVYSNYKMVINNLKVVSDYIYNAVSASVGNLTVTEKPNRILEIYHCMNMGMSLLVGWESVCLLLLFNPFIKLFFGEKYLLSSFTVLVIVIDFYILGMRQVTICFRNAMGLFWNDRYKPIFEVGINMVASLILVKKLGIAGVILGTTISSILTNFWVEPYVFFKYGIRKKWKKNLASYYFKYGKYTLFTAIYSILVSKIIINRMGDFNIIMILFMGIGISIGYVTFAWIIFGRTGEWIFFVEKAESIIKHFSKRKIR